MDKSIPPALWGPSPLRTVRQSLDYAELIEQHRDRMTETVMGSVGVPPEVFRGERTGHGERDQLE
jgi:hypothetical protein